MLFRRPFMSKRARLATLLMVLSLPAVAKVHDSTSVDELFEVARARMEAADYAGAAERLRELLAVDRNHLPARILLGDALLRSGKAAAAEDEFRAAMKAGADKYQVFRGLGNALLLQFKYKELLETIDDKDPRGSQRFEVRTLRGRAHYELGELDDAENEYKAALTLAPERSEALLGLADVAGARGDHDQVVSYLKRAAEVAPGDFEVWYRRGEAARARGDFDEAMTDISKSLEINGSNMRARLARANLFVLKGDYAKAREDAKVARDAQPNDAEATFLTWQVAMLQMDDAAAKEAGAATLKLLQGIPEATLLTQPALLRIASLITVAQRDYTRARTYLQRYADLRPNDPQMIKVLGDVQYRMGDFTTALSTMYNLARVLRDDPHVFAVLGSAYVRTQQYKLATEAFERAVELAPKDGALTAQLAASRLGSGDVDAALGILEPALGADVSAPEVGVFYAMLMMKRGEFAQAEDAIGRTEQAHPGSAFVLNVHGSIKARQHDLAGARAKFEAAEKADPRYLPASFNLAELDLHERDDADAARARLRRILDVDPRFVPALNLLADIALAEGKSEEALDILQKVNSIDADNVRQADKLTKLYLALGRAEDAMAVADKLVSRNDRRADALLLLARVQRESGKETVAATTLRSASNFAGLDADLQKAIAAEQVAISDYQGARWTLQKAMAARDDGSVLPALVRLEIATGNDAEAEARIDAVKRSKLPPGSDTLLKSELLRHQGHLPEALAAAQRAHQQLGSSDSALAVYQLLAESGQPAQALALLEGWTKSHPDDLAAQRTLALGYVGAGKLDRARELHERILAENPNDTTMLANLARILQLQKQPGAREHAERAVNLRPNWSVGLDTLGWILAGEGDLAGGLKYLRQASARDANALTRYHIAAVLNELGRPEEARSELNEMLQGTVPDGLKAEALRLRDSLPAAR